MAILIFDHLDRKLDYMVELHHALVEAGHSVTIPPKSILELGMKVTRISRLVKETEADAWVVCAGPRELLEWFTAQKIPVFALFGRRIGLPVAATGPDKPPALAAATRHLIDLGHRRITLLARVGRRQPEPGESERAFLQELAAHEIPAGEFNLPDWEESREGFQKLLDSLFQITPPTALIVDEVLLFSATLQFLAKKGIQIPEDISVVCTDSDPSFAWCEPSIAHIHWDPSSLAFRIARWSTDLSLGRHNEKQSFIPAEFIDGGTVGAVPS